MGVVVQAAVVCAAHHAFSMHYLAATALGVGAAVVHNFVWHWQWTWRDRGLPAARAPDALVRFVLANGVVSLACNLLIVRWLVGSAGVPLLAATLAAIAAGGAANFLLADRLIFMPPPARVPPAWRSRRAPATCRQPPVSFP
jgi:putative flippase GtrA